MHAKLCYIKDAFAYFTDSAHETGDDWNDAPYEHNAGTPYGRGAITMLAYQCDALETPAQRHGENSPYSVDQINAKQTPWLAGYTGSVWAGASPQEFTDAIETAGGRVFVEVTP